jgi:hypothetical protein
LTAYKKTEAVAGMTGGDTMMVVDGQSMLKHSQIATRKQPQVNAG